MVNHLNTMKKSLERAFEMEKTGNIVSAELKKTSSKDFLIIFYLKEPPGEVDLESMSCIETEVLADNWGWMGKLNYKWLVR